MRQFVPMDAEQEKAYVELKELFKHFDTDGSGELASDEVAELLETMGVNVNADELAKLIQMMDVDCSGSLMCLRHLCAVLHARACECACECAFACVCTRVCTRASAYANK